MVARTSITFASTLGMVSLTRNAPNDRSIFYGLDIWLLSLKLLSYPLNLLGMVFIIIGISLTSWCFKVASALPKKPILVNWGPWAHVRHPIFLAGILFNLGVTMMIGTTLLILQFIGYSLFEIIGTRHEERNLRKVFPHEYEEYSKQGPAWIPKIRK